MRAGAAAVTPMIPPRRKDSCRWSNTSNTSPEATSTPGGSPSPANPLRVIRNSSNTVDQRLSGRARGIRAKSLPVAEQCGKRRESPPEWMINTRPESTRAAGLPAGPVALLHVGLVPPRQLLSVHGSLALVAGSQDAEIPARRTFRPQRGRIFLPIVAMGLLEEGRFTGIKHLSILGRHPGDACCPIQNDPRAFSPLSGSPGHTAGCHS